MRHRSLIVSCAPTICEDRQGSAAKLWRFLLTKGDFLLQMVTQQASMPMYDPTGANSIVLNGNRVGTRRWQGRQGAAGRSSCRRPVPRQAREKLRPHRLTING